MQNGIPVGLRSSPSFGLSRSGQLTAIIQSLFWDGSQGWWYDDNDTTTLFQDSAGTTPVTAVEQFVGLQLDKSKGLVLGPELVTTPSTSVSGAQSVTVGGTITAGKFYKISATVSNYSGVGDLGFSGANFFVLAGVTRLSGNGVMAGIVWASGTGALIVFGRSTNAATFSDISVRELPGNHRYALASGNRPIWSKRVNLYVGTTALTTQNVTTQATSYVLRFSGTGSITLSGTATGSFNAGVHTVTCTAGTLTSTVSGTVTDADLRPANQATGLLPLYQRVNTSSDYDTNGFPGYFKADGIDDFLQTNSINFSAGPTNPPLGPELVTNGDFTSGTTGWTVTGGGATIAAVSGELRISGQTSSPASVTQNISTVVGKTYRVTATYRMAGSGGTLVRFDFGINSTNNSTSTNITSTVVFTATSTLTALSLLCYGVSTTEAYFDNISVKEITNANLGADKITLCAGVRKLSDATEGMLSELSANAVSNNGSFFSLPNSSGIAAANTFAAFSHGTAGANVSQLAISAATPAPVTVVFTRTHNISGDLSAIRLNGAASGTNGTGDQGTGNYGNYPAYFFRRGGSSLPFNGYEYGNIAVGKLLTADQTVALETYMNGLTKAY